MERQDLSRTYLAHHELESAIIIIVVVINIVMIIVITIINACCPQVRIFDRQQWVGSMARQWFG